MNVSEMSEFITVLLILIGSIISVISAIGIIRFPDVYTRSHAATKSSTLAVLLTLIGAFLYFLFTESLVNIRLILGIVFVFITSPVAGHLIIRAAYRSRVKLADSTIEDELKDVLHPKE
ncbi:Na+/H+ antiporter subunit G [Lederbergia sp. NSJ-179]|uniref:Na+/H+ antiporter subunit G n=1 Tax=Lederbergia sp. NSJ-179 TaxID=2931402 RepID=UPI001FD316AB|nr:Na+/H+ antiporter subunit G [Lederbergia sp. NSJ-179]MCJ7840081.1 Na+/H+ antiporter subunit G [Lederbergia sp. NSJ-179]